jgi:hypothetical protein
MLKQPEANINASATIQAFYATANASTHAYKKMWDIEEAISTGNYATATSLANEFLPTNDIEMNYRRYALLCGKFYSTLNATQSDMDDLLSLAMSCPHTKGNIIYQARAMHNSLNPTNVIVFVDNCDGAGLYKTKPTNSIIKSLPFDASLYPNPAADVLYVTTNLPKDALIILELVDTKGKLISKQECHTTLNSCSMQTSSFSKGIYFIKITNSITNETITKKVVLQ